MKPLRLMVYDRTCGGNGVGLSTVWGCGARLYRGMRRHDASFGAASWSEALAWIAEHDPSRPIGEIQYWGHGKWGKVFIGRESLGAAELAVDHRHAEAMTRIRERLLPAGQSLVWIRTCETFGADAGIDFAVRLSERLGARIAGHTYIIGVLQSGLRALAPGRRPTWSATEGLKEGTAAAPTTAHDSSFGAPRTVHFMTNEIPRAWFDEDGR